MSNNRLIYLDILRLIAIFAVVVQHTSNLIVYYESVGSYEWWIGHIFNSMTRFLGVPVFLLITGLLLLDNQKKESYTFFS